MYNLTSNLNCQINGEGVAENLIFKFVENCTYVQKLSKCTVIVIFNIHFNHWIQICQTSEMIFLFGESSLFVHAEKTS